MWTNRCRSADEIEKQYAASFRETLATRLPSARPRGATLAAPNRAMHPTTTLGIACTHNFRPSYDRTDSSDLPCAELASPQTATRTASPDSPSVQTARPTTHHAPSSARTASLCRERHAGTAVAQARARCARSAQLSLPWRIYPLSRQAPPRSWPPRTFHHLDRRVDMGITIITEIGRCIEQKFDSAVVVAFDVQIVGGYILQLVSRVNGARACTTLS